MKNILITSAGKRVALTKVFKETLTKFFSDGKVYITDMNPMMAPVSYVADGAIKVPRVTSEDYIAILQEICEKYDIGLIIPTIDTELAILAANKDIFKRKGVIVDVSDYDFIMTCRDKRNTSDFFEQHQIEYPKLYDRNHLQYPLFAKPYDGSLSTNLHYLKSADEMTPEILNDAKLIFMEYIDKKIWEEYTVDIYYNKYGDAIEIVPRKRIEIRAGEINKGLTIKNEIVPYLKERIGHIDGCHGCICIQLFYHPDTHEVRGIEINPRFGGGYPLSYAAGANYPEYLIREHFLNEELVYTEDWQADLLMLRYDDAIYTRI